MKGVSYFGKMAEWLSILILFRKQAVLAYNIHYERTGNPLVPWPHEEG
jgi:hypothetical protein